MSRMIVQYIEEQVRQPVPVISGTPDYWEIRKIEEEIFGEAMTLYPGDWREITKESHWKHHARYSFDYAAPGCVWCEDHRQDRVRAMAEVEAKYAKPARRWNDWVYITAARVGIPVGVFSLIFGLWVWLVIAV